MSETDGRSGSRSVIEFPIIGIEIDLNKIPYKNDQERRLWPAEVWALMRVAYFMAKEVLGEERSSILIKTMLKKSPGRKKGTRNKGSLLPEILVMTYIKFKTTSTNPREDVFKKTAHYLYTMDPKAYGNSEDAIARRIRRLINQRRINTEDDSNN